MLEDGVDDVEAAGAAGALVHAPKPSRSTSPARSEDGGGVLAATLAEGGGPKPKRSAVHVVSFVIVRSLALFVTVEVRLYTET